MPSFDVEYVDHYVLPIAELAYQTGVTGAYTKLWEIFSEPPLAAQAEMEIIHAGPAERSVQAPPRPSHMSAYNAMLRHPAHSGAGASHASVTLSQESAAPASNLHFGYVFADADTHTLIVAIRGTVYFEEWLKDFDFAGVPYEPIADSGEVHHGFQIVYHSIRDNLMRLIQQARAEFPDLTNLLMTGHSLGAAVIGLAAPDLIRHAGAGLNPLVYTFAEPRVGRPRYKEVFDSIVPLCFRINNIWDIVPHAPPFLLGYEHEGQEVDIDSGFTLDVAHNHLLKTGYKPGLDKLLPPVPAARSMELESARPAADSAAWPAIPIGATQ